MFSGYKFLHGLVDILDESGVGWYNMSVLYVAMLLMCFNDDIVILGGGVGHEWYEESDDDERDPESQMFRISFRVIY